MKKSNVIFRVNFSQMILQNNLYIEHLYFDLCLLIQEESD